MQEDCNSFKKNCGCSCGIPNLPPRVPLSNKQDTVYHRWQPAAAFSSALFGFAVCCFQKPLPRSQVCSRSSRLNSHRYAVHADSPVAYLANRLLDHSPGLSPLQPVCQFNLIYIKWVYLKFVVVTCHINVMCYLSLQTNFIVKFCKPGFKNLSYNNRIKSSVTSCITFTLWLKCMVV